MKSEMAVMGPGGDTKIIWDADNDDEVKNARTSFDALQKKGFSAFKVNRKGDKSEQIRTFDPEAEKIILVPQMAGG